MAATENNIIAERLLPNSHVYNERNSVKYKISCQERLNTSEETSSWLELTELIDHDSKDYKVYKSLLDKKRVIAAKIGPKTLKEEYEIGAKLEELDLPTFISFNCLFNCLDNFSTMNTTRKYVCKKEGDPINILIMPFIKDGRLDKWKWNRDNLNVLKNVMKHICMSLLLASQKLNFIHDDLHLANILLKKTQKKQVIYGDLGSLELMGLLPVIMDFEKSKFTPIKDKSVFTDIKRMSYSIFAELGITFDINTEFVLGSLIQNYHINKLPVTQEMCSDICKAIDGLKIVSLLTNRPKTPDWLKPAVSK